MRARNDGGADSLRMRIQAPLRHFNYKPHLLQRLTSLAAIIILTMADDIGSAAGKAAGKAALKSFMSPSIDIVKTVQGIVELILRGSGAVSTSRLSHEFPRAY